MGLFFKSIFRLVILELYLEFLLDYLWVLNRFAKGFFDPLIELYRPVPPLAWAPLIISVLGIDNVGKVFLLLWYRFLS